MRALGGWCLLNDGSMLVVCVEVAVLAEALAIVCLARVRARPGLLRPSAPVIAVNAHALRVVLTIRVRALPDHSLRRRADECPFFGYRIRFRDYSGWLGFGHWTTA